MSSPSQVSTPTAKERPPDFRAANAAEIACRGEIVPNRKCGLRRLVPSVIAGKFRDCLYFLIGPLQNVSSIFVPASSPARISIPASEENPSDCTVGIAMLANFAAPAISSAPLRFAAVLLLAVPYFLTRRSLVSDAPILPNSAQNFSAGFAKTSGDPPSPTRSPSNFIHDFR